jgi:hypothetical protein
MKTNQSMIQAMDQLDKVVRIWQQDKALTTIKPTLRPIKTGNKTAWCLQFVEDREPNTYHTSHLDECVEWANGHLQNWPSCVRKAWDMWDFDSKKDAEKFITFFHLSWQQ